MSSTSNFKNNETSLALLPGKDEDEVESRSWISQLVSEPRGSRSRVDKIEGRDVLGYTMVHRSVVTGRSVVLSSLCANVSEGRTEEAADIRMLMSTARRILY
ncbi:hypothetical protein Tco_0783806 [Tanacetum coccineum]